MAATATVAVTWQLAAADGKYVLEKLRQSTFVRLYADYPESEVQRQ